MKKKFFFLLILILSSKTLATEKDNVIENFKNIQNLTFNFEQNINDKIENGKCTLSYPKKIYCKYNLSNQKTLVSNGKSIVIKTSSSYYLYPLERTPLNLILDKDYLLNKITNIEERVIDEKFINYKFFENDHEINVFLIMTPII